MSFFKLRILNTSLIFIIGILLGFIIKDKMFAPKTAYAPQSSLSRENMASPAPEISDKEEQYNVFDDDETFDMPEEVKKVKSQKAKEAAKISDSEDETIKFMDFSGPFFANPAKFKNEIVFMDAQMIFARKVDSHWRLNLMHVDSEKGVKYVYLDSDTLLTDNSSLKIGYFYRVSFKCEKGLLNKGNILLSIAATGKKAEWATGVSAIE